MPDAPPFFFFVLYGVVGSLAYIATDSVAIAAAVYLGLVALAATVGHYTGRRHDA